MLAGLVAIETVKWIESKREVANNKRTAGIGPCDGKLTGEPLSWHEAVRPSHAQSASIQAMAFLSSAHVLSFS